MAIKKVKKYKLLIFVLFILASKASAFTIFETPKTMLEAGGQLKNMFIATMYYDSMVSPDNPDAVDIMRARLKIRLELPKDLSLNTHYELVPIAGQQQITGFFSYDNLLSYRAFDIKKTIISGGTLTLDQNFDRLYLTWALKYFDITLGRQAVSFGSARAINPTDVFFPFGYGEPDKEHKRGIDAARVTIPFGSMSEVELLYVAGKKFSLSKSAFLTRVKTNFFDYDFALSAALLHYDIFAGLDISGAIKNAGVWLESGLVFPDMEKDKEKREPAYVRISTGVDYNFEFDLYVFLEYHYQSLGTNKVSSYENAALRDPIKNGESFLLGRHYLIPNLRWQLHPLVNAGVSTVINLTDPSVIFVPNIEYNAAENVTITAGASIAAGKRPTYEETAAGIFPQMKSEFGTMHDYYYLLLGIYF